VTATRDRIIQAIRPWRTAARPSPPTCSAVPGSRASRPAPTGARIVTLVAAGATDAEIARRLLIGLPTAEGSSGGCSTDTPSRAAQRWRGWPTARAGYQPDP
jgi:hypothetical protein